MTLLSTFSGRVYPVREEQAAYGGGMDDYDPDPDPDSDSDSDFDLDIGCLLPWIPWHLNSAIAPDRAAESRPVVVLE